MLFDGAAATNYMRSYQRRVIGVTWSGTWRVLGPGWRSLSLRGMTFSSRRVGKLPERGPLAGEKSTPDAPAGKELLPGVRAVPGPPRNANAFLSLGFPFVGAALSCPLQ